MHNPLHPPVHPSQCSTFSELSAALSDKNNRSSRLKRLPQGTYTSGSKWRNATERMAPLHPSVTFEYAGHPNFGVKMVHMTRATHGAPPLAGGNDTVLSDSGIKRVNLRILWPGYSDEQWVRSIEITPTTTRGLLASAIAKNFLYFMEKNRSTACQGDPKWSVGRFRFDQLILRSLYHVSGDSWQADVYIMDGMC